jgi:hypothetical protein
MRHFGSIRSQVLAGVLAGLVAAGSTASAATIHACAKNNGQLRLVAAPADCQQNETHIQWSGEGVKTISGLVGGAGEQFLGTGYSVSRIGPGHYRIVFPPGTWASFPIMVVSPFGLPGAFPVAEIGGATALGDGSASFDVLVSSTAGPFTPLDSAFWFITTAS